MPITLLIAKLLIARENTLRNCSSELSIFMVTWMIEAEIDKINRSVVVFLS